MSRYLFHTPIMIALCAACCVAPAQAQETVEQLDSVTVLRTQLDDKRADLLRMKRILESLNAVDSAYKPQYPSWIVRDEDIRERIFRSFRLRYPNLDPNGEVVVVVNPSANEILEIAIGATVMGRQETYQNLSDSLHREIMGGSYPKRTLDPHSLLRPRFGMLLQSQPTFAALSASAFRASLMFSGGRGIEFQMGHEEIGYHFWSTGDVRVMANLGQFTVGVMIPFRFGLEPNRVPSPLAIRNRLMVGALGISMEFEQPWGDQSFVANLSVGEVNKDRLSGLLTDLDKLYYVHTVAQLRYSRYISIGSPDHSLLLTGGFGYHQIALGASTPAQDRITTIKKENFISPILRAEYAREGPYRYGISVQYYSGILYTKTWVELLRDFLFLDVQYYSPFLRNPRPWEHPYFYMISPRIQVTY